MGWLVALPRLGDWYKLESRLGPLATPVKPRVLAWPMPFPYLVAMSVVASSDGPSAQRITRCPSNQPSVPRPGRCARRIALGDS